MKALYGALAVLAITLSSLSKLHAQQSVSIGTTTIDSDAVLFLLGDGTQGLIVPKTSSLTGMPKKAGMVVYYEADGKVYSCDGTTWSALGGGATGTTPALIINGNQVSIFTGQNVNLAATAPTQVGQLFMWDGTKWTATSPPANPLSAGQVLVWGGTSWQPQTLPTGGTVTNVTGTAPISVATGTTTPVISLTNSGVTAGNYGNTNVIPQLAIDALGRITAATNITLQNANATTTGLLSSTDWTTFNNKLGTGTAASGDLTGTYPSPTIATGAVTSAKIADGTIAASDLSAMGATNSGQVLQWNGTAWAPATVSGTTFGNLTSVTTGINIVGGTGAVAGTGVTIDIQNATATQPGLLTAADFTTFNNKVSSVTAGTGIATGGTAIAPTVGLTNTGVTANTYGSATQVPQITVDAQGRITGVTLATISGGTFGNLTSTTTGVNITGGTGAVAGSGATVDVQNATATQPGLLTAADFTTFNNKLGASSTPASGDIAGDYATGFQINANAVTATEIADGSITAAKLSAIGASSGNILKYNGTNWVLSTDDVGGGTVPTLTPTQVLIGDGTNNSATALSGDATINAGVLTLANSAGTRTNLGLGTLATLSAVDLTTTEATGTLPIGKGGTGVTTTPGNGQVLIGNGAGYTAATLTAGTNVSITNGAGSITINANGLANPMTTQGDIIYGGVGGTPTALIAGTGFLRGGATPTYSAIGLATTDVTGTLPITSGGTGATTAAAALVNLGAMNNPLTTAGDIIYRDGTGPQRLAAGTGFLRGGATPTYSAIGLATTDVTGTLPITSGGTGATTPSAALTALGAMSNPMTSPGDLIYGGVSGAPTRLNGGAVGILKTNGTTPTWGSVALATTDVSGTLPVANGGTGATTLTGALMGNGTSAVTAVVHSAGNQYLRRNSGNTAYEFGDLTLTSGDIVDGTIMDIDVNTAAAIAGTKIAPNFGSQNILTTGNIGIGTASPTAQLNISGASASIDITNTGGGQNWRLMSDTDGTLKFVKTSGTTFPPLTLNGLGAIGIYDGVSSVTYGAAGQVLTSAGPGAPPTWSPAGGSGWSLSGNAGTTAANFLGTIDAQPLVFKTGVGGVERMRIDAAGFIGIGTNTPTVLMDVRGVDNSNFDLTSTSGVKLRSTVSTSFSEFGNVSNHDLHLFTNNTPRMAITAAGKIGIETNAPVTDLQIGPTSHLFDFPGATALSYNLYESAPDLLHTTAGGASVIALQETEIGFFVNSVGVINDQFGATLANRMVMTETGVSINKDSPDPSAVLHLVSDVGASARGFMMPSVTTTDRDLIASPLTGLMIFNETTNDFNYYNGTAWQALGGGGGGWGLTGNSGIIDGTNFIGTTTAVPLTFRVNNQQAGRLESASPFGTFFGYQAGLNNGAAQNNVAIGYQALRVATSASNTAVGYQAMQNSSGGQNTALGDRALTTNTSGSGNTAIGMGALTSTNTSDYNTAVGLFALQFNTAASNTAVGMNAATFNSSGSNNVFVGYQAGYPNASVVNANQTGSNNTFLGANTGLGSSVQRTNATAIGANALVDADNTLVLGGTGVNAVNVGIGTTTPAVKLEVSDVSPEIILRTTGSGVTETAYFRIQDGSGTNIGWLGDPGSNTNIELGSPNTIYFNSNFGYRFGIGTQGELYADNAATPGTNGQVLTSRGSGLPAYWATPSGTTLISNPGTRNLLAGDLAGAANTGTDNVFMGYSAGNANTTAGQNTFIGSAAGIDNITGGLSTIVGWRAGHLGTNIQGNTLIGAEAGRSSNASINTFVGEKAGENTTTGGENIMLGSFTGATNITGSQLTMIGRSADVSVSNLTNATAIGSRAMAAQSNSLVLGSIAGVNGASNSVNVGIGTNTPSQRLDVNGSINLGNTTAELTSANTGNNVNIAPIAYCFVTSTGGLNSQTSNVTSINKTGTGLYEIAITGEDFSTITNYVVQVTVSGSAASMVSTSAGVTTTTSLRVLTFASGGAAADRGFNVTVFKR